MSPEMRDDLEPDIGEMAAGFFSCSRRGAERRFGVRHSGVGGLQALISGHCESSC